MVDEQQDLMQVPGIALLEQEFHDDGDIGQYTLTSIQSSYEDTALLQRAILGGGMGCLGLGGTPLKLQSVCLMVCWVWNASEDHL